MALSPTETAFRDNVNSEMDTAINDASVKVEKHAITIEEFQNRQGELRDSTGRLHFYWIELERNPSEERNHRGRFVNHYVARIFGHFEIRSPRDEEADRDTFRTEIEAIKDQFRGNTTVFGSAEDIQNSPRELQEEDFDQGIAGHFKTWQVVMTAQREAVEHKAF